jgi:hypothetical protein
MKHRDAARKPRSGCGLLVVASVATCLLLLVNRVFVTSLYAVVVPGKFDFDRPRIMLQFLFMIGLLLPEWWLIDRIVQLLRASLPPKVTSESKDNRSF